MSTLPFTSSTYWLKEGLPICAWIVLDRSAGELEVPVTFTVMFESLSLGGVT